MSTAPSWRFVDGDVPGDGAWWLEHPTQMWGFIAFVGREGAPERHIMVVAKSFVEASLAELGRGAKSTAFAAMLVVPDGSPDAMRGAIDEAVAGGGLSFVLGD
jgi:hypothetical protein